MHTTIEQAYEHLEGAKSDVIADYGDEGLDSAWADVVESVAWECTNEVAIELFRREVGFVPSTFAEFRGVRAQDFIDSDVEGW